MPVITAPLLGSINNGLNLAFNTQLYAATDVCDPFVYDATSTGAAEVYPQLSMLPGMREWIGPREVHSLSNTQMTIVNKTFEETIAIKREDIEDDKYGQYSIIAGQLGRDGGQERSRMIAKAMANATTAVGFDGKPFFSATHPSFDANGKNINVSNIATGTSPGWYLVDTTQMLKPFIFQRRRPIQLLTRFNLADPAIFNDNEFQWGIDGRYNAGYGLWQLAYYSTQPFTAANLTAARTAMALIRRPNGTPMGIVPDTVVVPSTLYPLAKSYYEAGLIGSDPATPTTLVQNTIVGMFKPIEFKWLN